MKKNIFKTLAVTVLSAVSLTAWAVDPYAGLVNTTTAVHFNDYDWYIIEDNSTAVDAGTVTLLAADTRFGTSKFKSDESSNSYNSSDVKTYLESIVAGTAGEGKPNFSAVADAIKPVTLTTYEYRSETVTETTENAKLYLLSTEEAKKLSVEDVLKIGKEEDMIYWWLRSPGEEDFFQQEVFAAMVYGDYGFVYDGGFSVLNELLVRPALQLDLSKVSFDAETNTFSATAAASVATPTFSPADAAKSNIWYDLNGRHYQGKPTMQGVYINNHQKYVVK